MPYLILLVVLLSGCSKNTPPEPSASSAKSDGLAVSANATRNAAINTAVAEEVSLDYTLEAPGKLTWDEDSTVSIGVVSTGKIVQVLNRVGDSVSKGQVLARMHSHDVHDTKALLRQARAERDRAAAALEFAKRNEDRTRRLFELKAVSQAQVEQSRNDRAAAESALRKAAADVDRETQHLTEILEISADDESAPNHKHNEEEEELVQIKSTAAGVIVDRKISSGAVVTLGQEAFIVTDPASLWVIASFPESALARLKVGLPLELDVRAFPGRRFPARITRLGETLDPATRTLQVRAEVAAQGVLKPEMIATVRLRIHAGRALVVPESAVQNVEGKSTVFVESAPGRFQPREVVGHAENGRLIVESGLKAGERVATEGSYFLKSQLMSEGAH